MVTLIAVIASVLFSSFMYCFIFYESDLPFTTGFSVFVISEVVCIGGYLIIPMGWFFALLWPIGIVWLSLAYMGKKEDTYKKWKQAQQASEEAAKAKARERANTIQLDGRAFTSSIACASATFSNGKVYTKPFGTQNGYLIGYYEVASPVPSLSIFNSNSTVYKVFDKEYVHRGYVELASTRIWIYITNEGQFNQERLLYGNNRDYYKTTGSQIYQQIAFVELSESRSTILDFYKNTPLATCPGESAGACAAFLCLLFEFKIEPYYSFFAIPDKGPVYWRHYLDDKSEEKIQLESRHPQQNTQAVSSAANTNTRTIQPNVLKNELNASVDDFLNHRNHG